MLFDDVNTFDVKSPILTVLQLLHLRATSRIYTSSTFCLSARCQHAIFAVVNPYIYVRELRLIGAMAALSIPPKKPS